MENLSTLMDQDEEDNMSPEDHKIVTNAVKTVVRLSKKGIVSLCMEMAQLMKHNDMLRKEVVSLKRKNRLLKNKSPFTSESSLSASGDDSTDERDSIIESETSISLEDLDNKFTKNAVSPPS